MISGDKDGLANDDDLNLLTNQLGGDWTLDWIEGFDHFTYFFAKEPKTLFNALNRHLGIKTLEEA